MVLIIAGGRDYVLESKEFAFLDEIHRDRKVTEVVSGGAGQIDRIRGKIFGADLGGEAWARLNHIPIKQFLPDWNQHGKAAGPIRNGQMAEYADAVVLFPGGRGTADMKRKAIANGLEIFEFVEHDPERKDL